MICTFHVNKSLTLWEFQVSMGQYQHRTYRTITMVRGGLVSLIYRKTSALSLRDVDPAASMTLMSADVERIVQGWQTMHEIWANVVEVGVAIYLLERQLGVACVVPVAVSIRKSPVQFFIWTVKTVSLTL